MDKDHMRWTRAGIRILVSLFSVRVLVCSTRVARLSNHRVQQSKQNTSPHRVAAATRPIENKGDEGTKGRNKGDTHLSQGTKGTPTCVAQWPESAGRCSRNQKP